MNFAQKNTPTISKAQAWLQCLVEMVGRQIFSAYIVKTGNSDTDRDSATGGEVIEQILNDYQADIIDCLTFLST